MRFYLSIILIITVCISGQAQRHDAMNSSLREVNTVAQAPASSVIAIVGANLIDGRGGPVVADSVVVIRGDRILVVGKQGAVKIPSGAEVIDAKGLTLLPGLIDSHFHIAGDDPLPALYL